jgi:GNAT superfamily N-acetyltransferase
MPDYRIERARPEDLPLLPSIELAAATLLADHAPASVLQETTSLAVFEDAMNAGRLWVACVHGFPVGFALAEVLEPSVAHLKEIDVHPLHARQGIGSRLVQTVCAWAEQHQLESLTLTTFRDVPFNLPFYARLGFKEIPLNQLSRTLRAVLSEEASRGLDPNRRVAMHRRLRSEIFPSLE